MALSESTISKIRRYGRAEAASHPDLEDWYNDAITDEDTTVWGNLYEDAMAAKTAHLCLVFAPNGDGNARGIITTEPVGSTNGNRSYKCDYGSDDWWKQTPAGARYLYLASQAVGGDGMSSSPMVCF
jgi:hypothetical protein